MPSITLLKFLILTGYLFLFIFLIFVFIDLSRSKRHGLKFKDVISSNAICTGKMIVTLWAAFIFIASLNSLIELTSEFFS